MASLAMELADRTGLYVGVGDTPTGRSDRISPAAVRSLCGHKVRAEGPWANRPQ
jgi:hypothetical protein